MLLFNRRNMFIWIMLSIGNAIMMVLYNREFFYRISGPKTAPSGILWSEINGLEDFFIPRTFRLQFPDYFPIRLQAIHTN